MQVFFVLLLFKLLFIISYSCYGYNSHGYTNHVSLGLETGLTFYSIQRVYGESDTVHTPHVGFPLRLFVNKSAIESLNYGLSLSGYLTTGRELKDDKETPAELVCHIYLEGSFLEDALIVQLGGGFMATLTEDIDDARVFHPSLHVLLGYNIHLTKNWYIPLSFRLDLIFKSKLLLLRPTIGFGFGYRFILS